MAKGKGGIKRMTEAARNYRPYQHGQITKTEAGTIYRAYKDGGIEVKPETVKELYDATNSYIRFANERYNQDYLYYDRVYTATKAILNNDFKTAQKEIQRWEQDNIERSSKKSKWYKYRKNKAL